MLTFMVLEKIFLYVLVGGVGKLTKAFLFFNKHQ